MCTICYNYCNCKFCEKCDEISKHCYTCEKCICEINLCECGHCMSDGCKYVCRYCGECRYCVHDSCHCEIVCKKCGGSGKEQWRYCNNGHGNYKTGYINGMYHLKCTVCNYHSVECSLSSNYVSVENKRIKL